METAMDLDFWPIPIVSPRSSDFQQSPWQVFIFITLFHYVRLHDVHNITQQGLKCETDLFRLVQVSIIIMIRKPLLS